VADYTFSQLMGLWEQAGGSKGFAGLMAGVAEVESGGNPNALNPSGATGLWQIEWPLHEGITPAVTSQQALYNPQINARAAVVLADNSMTNIYNAWLRNEPPGAAEAIAKQNGQAAPSVPPLVQPLPGAAGSTTGSGPLSDLTGAVSQAGTLLGDAAKALDWFFHFFKPGQGWRIAFGGAAVLAAVGGVKSWQSASQSDDPAGTLPLAVALFALSALAAFMTLRQWPQPGGKPIKPGAYAVDIVEGKPPEAGTAPASDAPAIEVGLGAILALWGASKAAQGLSGLGGLIAGLGALLGSGAGEDV